MSTLSKLHDEIKHAVEVATNCAGPDGAKNAIHMLVGQVFDKFKGLGLELAPVAEGIAAKAVDVGLAAAAPALEQKLGEPAASIVEAGLSAAASAAEGIVADKLEEALAPEAAPEADPAPRVAKKAK